MVGRGLGAAVSLFSAARITQKQLKTMLFILTKYNMQSFGVIPFFQATKLHQLNGKKLDAGYLSAFCSSVLWCWFLLAEEEKISVKLLMWSSAAKGVHVLVLMLI